ncbi:S5A-REDUCTASE domain-containing protein [Mycena sanguinolenta]|uniref:S5A-REDUCTASE domain-containing protein n=1 Tax=Mycena sanguinolenta TaxID=230812 RepID=A0A8H7D989_9AGAR|nr:S5A-REDUCTASE domain-containing protein [Mycena sanguinolenta]
MSSKPPPRGPFHRENSDISIPGTATFALGRLADAPLQYTMFARGLAVKGLASVGLRASNVLVTAVPGFGGLGPIPTLLTGMYAVAGIRQAYWAVFTANNYYSTSASLGIVFCNTAINIVNTLAAVHVLISTPNSNLGSFTDFIGWKQWAGLTIFAIGIAMETIAKK